MQRRGLEVSAVGLGCATMTPFCDEPDEDAAIDTLRRAREIGVDFLDSSDAYGRGRNEELIARAVRGYRDEYVIASKFGNLRAADGSPTSDGRPEYAKACCERNLKRLKTDFIDLYYIHRVDPTEPIEDTVGAVGDLVRQGKVRHPGICEVGAATIRRAHAAYSLSAVQIECSLWTRDVEAEILPLCEELGIGFVAYRPLGRGFLTGKITDSATLRAGHARRSMPRFESDNRRRNLALVDKLKELAAAEKCTPAQLALAWVLSRAPYVVPIPDTSHRLRLEENAAAASLRISADTEDALLHVFASGAGERSALPGESPQASGDLTRTVPDCCDCVDGFPSDIRGIAVSRLCDRASEKGPTLRPFSSAAERFALATPGTFPAAYQ